VCRAKVSSEPTPLSRPLKLSPATETVHGTHAAKDKRQSQEPKTSDNAMRQSQASRWLNLAAGCI